MALILDPEGLGEEALRALVTEFSDTLVEMRDGSLSPCRSVTVLDPASLMTARELVDAALARMSPQGSLAELAASANLGYCTMLAAVDLLKSHTNVPRVPTRTKDPTGP